MLVGNAGVLGPLSPLAHVEPKDWDEVMAVNVTANWRLIRSLDPLLRALRCRPRRLRDVRRCATGARLLGALRRHQGRAGAWCAPTPRKPPPPTSSVNLFDPGPTRTRMRASAMPGEDPETLPTPETVADKIVDMCLPSLPGERADLRLSRRQVARFPAAGVVSTRTVAIGSSLAAGVRILLFPQHQPDRRAGQIESSRAAR